MGHTRATPQTGAARNRRFGTPGKGEGKIGQRCGKLIAGFPFSEDPAFAGFWNTGYSEPLKFTTRMADDFWQRGTPMDIAPISGIRPVTSIKPVSVAPDLPRVLEAEYLGQSGEDDYTPGNGKAARGLEDEEEEEGAESSTGSETPPTSSSLSLFA